MKRKIYAIIATLVFILPITLLSQYQIDRYVIGNGGGTSSNDNYSVSMTIGQPVVGITENDDITALLGFWHTLNQLSALEIILPGNAWSIISSYIIPQITDIEMMLEDIETNMLILKNNEGNMYFPALGINSIYNWDVLEGYKIYMVNQDVLTIEGLRVNPVSTPIPLETGWNIISYLRTTSMSVVTAFEGIVDDILIVKNSAGDMYFPALNINSLGQMNPTEGYKVYSYNNVDLYYPANGFPRRPAGNLTPKAKRLFPEVQKTGSSSTIFVNMGESYDGNEIGAFTTEGLLVGSGMIHEGISAINIWGDNSITELIDGARSSEPISFQMLDVASGEKHDIHIKNIESIISNDFMEDYYYQENAIHYAKGYNPESGYPTDVSLKNSPNPFADMTYIQYSLPATTDVVLEVYAMDGRLVFSKKINDQQKGNYSETFNAELMPSGMYLIKMNTEFGHYVSNMSIVK